MKRLDSPGTAIRLSIRPALLLAVLACAAGSVSTARAQSYADVIRTVQPQMVKIYGAGGIRGLEAYQSGFLISPEGHILTVWSYVLDADPITVVLDDGRRFSGELVGADPRLEIAVIKIEGDSLSHFALNQAVTADTGSRVLAFSNLFGVASGDEPNSVLHGIVSAMVPLAARRGAFETNYTGPVYVLDAMTNNPGAAGGALTDGQGRLIGLLGKELRNTLNNTWLNYALPIEEIGPAVDDILAGKVRPRTADDDVTRPDNPVSLDLLGITLIPDILAKTPPFIDRVRPDSPADRAGLKPDDLILFVNNRMASSSATFRSELSLIDQLDPVELIVQREQDLIEVKLKAEP